MDSIIISDKKNQDDSSNSSKYSQLNKINLNWRELLLNSSIAVFNIANKNFNSIDDFYQKFVLNLYPYFKIQDIFKTSNSKKAPYKLIALALYSKFTQNPKLGLLLFLTKDSKLLYDYDSTLCNFELLMFVRDCMTRFGAIKFDKSFIDSIISDKLVYGFQQNDPLVNLFSKLNCKSESLSDKSLYEITSKLHSFVVIKLSKKILEIHNNLDNKRYTFNLIKPLGNPGYEGVTFLASLQSTGQEFAIKTFERTHLHKQTQEIKYKEYNELAREASLQYIASLKGISPRIFGMIFDENKKIKGIIMEKLDYNLREIIKLNGGFLTKHQELSLVEIAIKLSKLCIVHNDNNPLNFMWSVKDNKFYYIDFGFSIFLSNRRGPKNLFINLKVLRDCFIGQRLGVFERSYVNSKGQVVNLPAIANRQWWNKSFINEITSLVKDKELDEKSQLNLEKKISERYKIFKANN